MWLCLLSALAHADDAALLAFVDEAATQVAERRGLALIRPVDAALYSVEELHERIEASLAEDIDPEELDAEGLALVLLGFSEPGIDLRAIYRDLFVEQVAGFYDPEEEQLFLVRRPDGDATPAATAASDKMVVEHEIVHALQDQHFGLAAIDSIDLGDSDVELALRALVEGDATFLGVLGMAGGLMDIADLPLGNRGAALDYDEGTALADAPDLLSRILVFPYTDGAAFARALYVAGGFEAIDAAYSRPPLSSEQILHPDRYMASPPDLPVALDLPDLAAELGSGWTARLHDTMGELGMLSWLDAVGGQDVSGTPLGWGGDRFVVLSDGRDAALVWIATFDDPDHATDFAARARQTLTAATGARRWRGERLGRVALLRQVDQDVVVVVGPPPRVARRLAEEALAGTTRRVRDGVDVFSRPPLAPR